MTILNLMKMAKSSINGQKTLSVKEKLHEQFLLFPWCFQKACFPGASKGVIVWEWIKLPFYLISVLPESPAELRG